MATFLSRHRSLVCSPSTKWLEERCFSQVKRKVDARRCCYSLGINNGKTRSGPKRHLRRRPLDLSWSAPSIWMTCEPRTPPSFLFSSVVGNGDESDNGSSRPFRILGIQQVAVGNVDKQAMVTLWIDILGLTRTGSHVSEKENVDEDILQLPDAEIDLMTPLDPNKSPKVHQPNLNHIGLWVDNLKAAVEWMDQKGVRFAPGGIRKGAAGYDVTFIHPKGNAEKPIGGAGVLIELVQAPPHIINDQTK